MRRRLLFVLVINFVFVGQLFSQDSFTLVKKGETAPDFSFEINPGQSKKLSDYKGKTVLINFFATWCGPCLQELPHIDKEIYTKYKEDDNFVIFNFGREHNWDVVNKFKADKKLNMPFYPDVERKIFAQFAGQNIPRSFLIDNNGTIIYSSAGYIPEQFETLKSLIASQLK